MSGDLPLPRGPAFFDILREVDHHDEVDVAEHGDLLAAVQRHLVIDDVGLLVEDDLTDLTDEQTAWAARLPVLRQQRVRGEPHLLKGKVYLIIWLFFGLFFFSKIFGGNYPFSVKESL